MAELKPDKVQYFNWALNLITSILLLIAVWYFNGINTTMSDIKNDMGDLKTKIALLQSTKEETILLRKQVLDLMGAQAETQKEIAVIMERLATHIRDERNN